MKKLSEKERFTLTARILIGIVLLWIIMRSGLAGSVMYWTGLEKGHIKIDIQEVYDMKKMPFGGYFPTFRYRLQRERQFWSRPPGGRCST